MSFVYIILLVKKKIEMRKKNINWDSVWKVILIISCTKAKLSDSKFKFMDFFNINGNYYKTVELIDSTVNTFKKN